jgi:hypothetical protein
MARDKWWRQDDAARGRYAPHLWSVWLVTPIWVTVAGVLAWVIFLRLRAIAVPHAAPNGGPASIDQLDVIKTTITVAGFVGAVLVGVYGYRRQRLIEGDARRADAEQLAQRYTTAAEALGHEKAAVRLAGVYAMARLADDWDEQRQVCIDVLCAYLRMPYEPDATNDKHRDGEREVRFTIIRLIRDHLQDPNPKASTSWCGLNLDFTNATFDGSDFNGAKFTGGKVSFRWAKFTDGEVSFRGAEFTDGEVLFENAEFTGRGVLFGSAVFTGGKVSFRGAEFIRGMVFFGDAEFVGGEVDFYAEFTSGRVFFGGARFTDGEVLFEGAKFGSGVSFAGAKFTGGKTSFDGVESTDKVSFARAEFTTGCSITWGPFEPPAAWTALQSRER